METLTKAAEDVLAERRRQVEVEGWTTERDDKIHPRGELARAAACYALESAGVLRGKTVTTPSDVEYSRGASYSFRPSYWPWCVSWWKPSNRRRNLVKAGALILAEIERLDRAAARA